MIREENGKTTSREEVTRCLDGKCTTEVIRDDTANKKRRAAKLGVLRRVSSRNIASEGDLLGSLTCVAAEGVMVQSSETRVATRPTGPFLHVCFSLPVRAAPRCRRPWPSMAESDAPRRTLPFHQFSPKPAQGNQRGSPTEVGFGLLAVNFAGCTGLRRSRHLQASPTVATRGHGWQEAQCAHYACRNWHPERAAMALRTPISARFNAAGISPSTIPNTWPRRHRGAGARGPGS